MGLFNKVFKKKEPEVIKVVIPPNDYSDINLLLPENEIVPFPKDVLDTTSPENIAIFKHNLEILICKTREDGKIKNFKIIREDDYFPYDFKWRALCSSTNMEESILGLSYAIRMKCALENANIENTFNGLDIPVDPKAMTKALSSIDKKTGFIYQPSRFRSTKHFTVNTPLEITGSYNSVRNERNFIVIDSIDNFLKSGYGYSISYYDAYLDVSHEALDISDAAVILIEKNRYDELSQNKELMEALAKRKLIIYKGDETLAIDMVLTEMEALPSEIGLRYANYDDDLRKIIASSIENLAYENGLLFSQSHAGYMNPENGHFSSYFDDYNTDHISFLEDFVIFMQNKMPEYANLFSIDSISDSNKADAIVKSIGTKPLLEAIREYNEIAIKKFQVRNREYIQDHDNISEEDHNAIIQTVHLISQTYSINMEFADPEKKAILDEAIRRFFQTITIKEQLDAARIVWDILGPRMEMTYEYIINLNK